MPKILIADDDLEIQELLKFTFENENYDVIVTSDGEEALLKVIAEKPDIVILDVNMPKMSGYEVCEKIRAHSATCLIPIIMLTSATKTKDRITGFKLGADEYIGKPFDSFELLARVEGLLKRMRESLSANPLTGLPGNISIEAEIKRRMDLGAAFCIVYSDADNFKAFNDKYGFEKGDGVIRLVAVLLRSAITDIGNNDDFIGHIGGEDFVLITTPDKLKDVTDKIIQDFDSLIPCQYDEETRSKGFIMGLNRQNQEFKFPIMSISLGALCVNPGQYRHYSEIVEKAKEVLKQAKAVQGSVLKIG
jgi:diguanylate cyclase (GGDEF)-like protein